MLERARRLPVLVRHPEQRRSQVAGRQRLGVPEAERLHRQGAVHRTRARKQRLTFDRARTAGPLPARRPPRCPARTRRQVHHARRQVRRQASQQPERRRRALDRRHLLHRSAVRPAGRWDDPAKELLPGRLPPDADGKLTLLTKEMTRRTASRFRPTRRRSTSRSRTRRRRSGWRIPVKADGTLGEGKRVRRCNGR